MPKETDRKVSSYNIFVKKLYDTSETLTKLIYFLQDNDERFKEFNCRAFLSLQLYISDEEETIILKSLRALRHLKINELPNTEGFRKILISNGADEKKFSIVTAKKILEVSAIESEDNGKDEIITASLCKIILANDDI